VKALLIAGGFGTRLRPLTLTRPKHLLPVANRPHLHHVFDLLQRHGIDDVVLLSSYMAETFIDSIRHARDRGMEVAVAHEETPLGTAGAIRNAAELVGDSTFFAFNGDILTHMDLSAVLAFHRDRQAEATIVLTPVDDPSAYGVVPTAADGRVEGFIEKPAHGTAPTNLINAGVYVMEPAVLDRIPAGEEYSAERALFPGMVDEGARLFATPTEAYWMDIGTPAKFLQANLDALTGGFETDAVPAPGPAAVVVDPSVERAPDGMLSLSCVGAGCELAVGASIERSVLLPGVRVEAGAAVADSILGEGVVIGAGAIVRGATLGDGEIVQR
jgi:NDP-sugar pyrophosphorylase family protein